MRRRVHCPTEVRAAVAEGGDRAEVDVAAAAARVTASSTSWSRCYRHWSAWRSRRRWREHCPTEVCVAVAEAEDRAAEVDAAVARVAASSTSWMHHQLHRSAWRSRRRSALHRPEAVEDGCGGR
ncbi:hypothetical protein E2562_022417 [Oryza meyeriana var. granulata]|uniref:Uncharacterized protein n=1 Tax=Oryza meyeriana var. granulata TaxID=110450 RepID=A0A6G1BMN0_9ORYZ|nr:hypothetical protein E2562_022417 [Oryza meyeriana var. granulata]